MPARLSPPLLATGVKEADLRFELNNILPIELNLSIYTTEASGFINISDRYKIGLQHMKSWGWGSWK